MTLIPQFKLNQLIKDFGLKSKDATDILKEKGYDVRTQKTLEPSEFDVLLEELTKANQINNIEDYIDGVTYIPSKKSKTPETKKAQKPAVGTQPAAAAHGTGKTNAKAEEGAAQEAKPAAQEAKPAAQEAKPAAQEARPAAQEAKPAAQEARPAAQEARPAAQEARPAAQEARPAAQEARPAAQEARPAAQEARPAAQEAKPFAREARPAAQGGRTAPSESAGRQFDGHKQDQQDSRRDRSASDQNQHGNRPAGQSQYGTPRPAGQGQSQYGTPRPAGQGQSQYGTPRPAGQGQSQYGTPRPAGQGQSQYGTPRPAGQGQSQYGTPRPAGQGQSQYGTPRPAGQGQYGRPSGQNPQRKNDRERDSQQGPPREKFQPQPIIRGQATKKDGQGGTRIVDTRGTSNVDLSKYDERLDNIVPEAIRDMRGGSEKVKRGKNTQNQQGGARNSRFIPKKSAPIKKQPVQVSIPDEISVSELASRLKVTVGEVVKRLMLMGMMVTVNQYIDYDTAYLVADELGAIITKEVVLTIEEKLFDEATDGEDDLVERAPVVCVMGHVDHGKTSLLDAIRHTNVTSGEAGGITQHIGAYRVKVKGRDITFLDTPGHEAFTAMRARGAQSTDIAILVVAADDGVMPQTVEAINHAKAAGIDIVVAINKMDKPTANPDHVMQELTKYNLVPEAWGGDVICVPVSALTNKGIDNLLENVLLVAEMKELKANPSRRAKGIVIEAKLDRGRGPVATVLVQNGTLNSGDVVIAGTAVGRVRAMTDYKGKVLKTAAPSVPVEITGLSEVPSAGDEFNAVEDEKMARTLADQRRSQAKEEVFKANARANLNDLFTQISEGVKVLNIIVKADVDGSAEAVKASLEKITNEEVKVKVIHSGAGGITEGDVMFAAASNAIIVGFNVRPDKAALDSAERQGVDIRTYRIIYECIEEVTAAMKGMLAPKFKEVVQGHAEVRQPIHVPNVGTIAGSYVQDGKITRASLVRVLRSGVVIFEDKISSLRRFKDDVREVASGYECGIGLEKFNDLKVGDILESYVMEEIQA